MSKTYKQATLICVGGQLFVGLRRCCVHFGVDYKTVQRLYYRKKWTIEEAIGIVPPPVETESRTGLCSKHKDEVAKFGDMGVCQTCKGVFVPEDMPRHGQRCKRCEKSKVLKTQHGIRIEDYESIHEEQGGVCAICGTGGITLHVDHCHASHVIRGLLCMGCNQALGLFGDSVDLMRSAVRYLETEVHDGTSETMLNMPSSKATELVRQELVKH